MRDHPVRIDTPKRAVRTYTQTLTGDPSQVFPLLCPVREADWIDGWDPVLVLSRSGVAEADCVFVTAAQPQNAIWYITRHEPNRFVEMIKITPGVTACKLTITVSASGSGSQATITYMHTSLGPDGDAFVDSFTEEYYEKFMRDWEARMNHYLKEGTALRG
jgi:hypothetical protein